MPLSWQAVEALRAARRLSGRGNLVFPGQRNSHRPLSENATGYLYNRVGFNSRHVSHGWRAPFSTIIKVRARKQRRFEDLDAIEMVLAYIPEKKVVAAYDRHDHLEQRRELLQDWEDTIALGLPPANQLLGGSRR